MKLRHRMPNMDGDGRGLVHHQLNPRFSKSGIATSPLKDNNGIQPPISSIIFNFPLSFCVRFAATEIHLVFNLTFKTTRMYMYMYVCRRGWNPKRLQVVEISVASFLHDLITSSITFVLVTSPHDVMYHDDP